MASSDELEKRIAELEKENAALRHERRFLRLALDNIPGMVFWKDAESVYLGCNAKVAEVNQLEKPESIVGMTDDDLSWGDQADVYRKYDQEVMAAGEPRYHIEETILQADGQRRWIDVCKIPLRDEAGNVVGVLGTSEDITERKQAEAQLGIFKALADNTTDDVAYIELGDHSAPFAYVNPAGLAMIGRAGQDPTTVKIADTHLPEDGQRITEEAIPIAMEHGIWSGETRLLHADGSLIDVSQVVVRIDGEDGHPRALGTIMRDITAQKQASDALEEQVKARTGELRTFKALADNAPYGITLSNMEGAPLYTNRALYEMLSYDFEAQELQGASLAEAFPPEEFERISTQVMPQLMQSGGWQGEVQYKRKDGSLFSGYVTVFLLKDEMGHPTTMVTLSQDITERKQAEAALRESQTLMQGIMDNLPVDVIVKDLEGHHVLVNQHALSTSGYTLEQVLGKTDADLFPPEFAKERQAEEARLIETGEPVAQEIVVPLPQRELYQYLVRFPIYDDDGNLYATGSVTTDISQLKQAEQERDRLQQEIIKAQREALQELSTPVIPVMDQILVMPLVGSIDTMRARDIMRMLLQGISAHRAQIVILDVTGVPIMDTGIVNHINKTIQAARLKGAHAIVTGISDVVAEAVVDLGIDWSDVQTLRDLQTGLRVALERLGRKLV